MSSETTTAAIGQEFTISLKSTPTTGYVWEVEKLPEGIQFLGSDYEHPGSATKPGAPLNQVFRFQVQKPGDHEITFIRKRQWETKPIDNHTAIVKAI